MARGPLVSLPGYSADQIRAAEAPYLAAGVPLMARASAGLADEVGSILAALDRDRRAHAVLLVGPGNNGADTLFAGAQLARDGIQVSILPVAERLHPEALAAALDAGAAVVDTMPAIHTIDVIVDGIVGIGASSGLRGVGRSIVENLLRSASRPLVVAVDIPSGIDPDTGAGSTEVVLPADVTVTFGGCKAGLLLPPGAAVAGRLVLIDIGIGPELATMEPLVPG